MLPIIITEFTATRIYAITPNVRTAEALPNPNGTWTVTIVSGGPGVVNTVATRALALEFLCGALLAS